MAESNDIGIAAENANNPEQPEYGKAYKPKMHSSCCGSCGETNCHDTPLPHSQTLITQRKTRADFV